MKKIYLGCSLTHSSQEFRDFVEDLKIKLKAKYELLDFYGLSAGIDRDIFKHDLKQVKACDLFLAELSHPATGLGFEIATALAHHKPILAIARPDSKVSRLILGIDSTLFSCIRYSSAEEILDAVEKKLAGII